MRAGGLSLADVEEALAKRRRCVLERNPEAAPPMEIRESADAKPRRCRPTVTREMRCSIARGMWKPAWEGADAFDVLIRLPASRLILTESHQQEHVVRAYADEMKRGRRFPPIMVIPVDDGPNRGKYRIANGHHRALAAQKARKRIWAWASVGNDCHLLQRISQFPWKLPPSVAERLRFPTVRVPRPKAA